MFAIPDSVMNQYVAVLKNLMIPASQYSDYKKWLRYFNDFCTKYPDADSVTHQVKQFLEKLKSKNQSEIQCRQAARAVSLYLEIQENSLATPQVKETSEDYEMSRCKQSAEYPQHSRVSRGSSHYCRAGYKEKSDSSEWDEVLAKLAAEIKVRHYSRKTLKTYGLWSRQFQKFLGSKPPAELSTADVKDYLTHLAVDCHVAASTQNQAFNSLLFLFRHALKREFGELRDVPRAKKSLYVPMVLSRREIDAILGQLSHPFDLFVKMLFGCGLRLFEGLQLRVRDFNFDDGVLTIHGKGKKDRTVPLPKTILAELKARIEEVATHLLQAGYDIRVIQKLLGHASLKTTMVYLHCVPVRTIKEPISPLDL